MSKIYGKVHIQMLEGDRLSSKYVFEDETMERMNIRVREYNERSD